MKWKKWDVVIVKKCPRCDREYIKAVVIVDWTRQYECTVCHWKFDIQNDDDVTTF